jgi:hypothetical protein
MSRFKHHTFFGVINFMISLWVPCHDIVGLFEAIDTFRIVTIAHVKDISSSYNLLDKLIACVKGEGGNLCTFTQTFTSVVNCGPLGFIVPW